MGRVPWLPMVLAAVLAAVSELAPYRGFAVPTAGSGYLSAVAAVAAMVVLATFLFVKDRGRVRYVADVVSVGLGATLVYEVLTNRAPFEAFHSPIFPSLNQVLHAYGEDWALLARCTGATLGVVVTGWLCGALAAVPLGVVLGWHRYPARVLSPYLKIANAIPIPTWIPILIVAMPTLWWSMSALIFIGSFFAVLNQTLQGIRNVDRRYVEAAAMLGSTDRQILLRVAVPLALPSILAGIQSAWILSIVLVIIAEMIGASTGLGWYLMYTRGWGEYHKVIAGMVWSGVIGLIGFEVLKRLDGRYLGWREGILR